MQTAISLTTKLNTLGAHVQVIRLGCGLTEACAAWIYGMLEPAHERQERPEFASVGKPMTGAGVRFRTDDGKFTRKMKLST